MAKRSKRTKKPIMEAPKEIYPRSLKQDEFSREQKKDLVSKLIERHYKTYSNYFNRLKITDNALNLYLTRVNNFLIDLQEGKLRI